MTSAVHTSHYNRYAAMTNEPAATTLAAYAVALLHGKELADFERENLLALAGSVGVTPTADDRLCAEAKADNQRWLLDEVHRLRTAKPPSFWARARKIVAGI